MNPYYQAGAVMIYYGDAREIVPSLVGIDALVADPPYGINYVSGARTWKNEMTGFKTISQAARSAIPGDDQPFDVRFLLGFSKVALFGASHYDHLPVGGKWLVWDKRRDSTPDDHSDCELIWTNSPGADRIHRQKWRGVVREGEENCSRSKKLHPNQKPVALLDFIFDQLGISRSDRVCDPYMGSGSTGAVAIRRGNAFIGIDIEERCCEIAAIRFSRELQTKKNSKQPASDSQIKVKE